MEAREDYQGICDRLLEALKLTRKYSDLVSITYCRNYNGERGRDIVEVMYDQNRLIKVNVSADSGIAMIYDILKWII